MAQKFDFIVLHVDDVEPKISWDHLPDQVEWAVVFDTGKDATYQDVSALFDDEEHAERYAKSTSESSLNIYPAP